tara:strand:+ start:281 stop:1015 length:735 start_codon:yes stop_codon:yes gene_type:complete
MTKQNKKETMTDIEKAEALLEEQLRAKHKASGFHMSYECHRDFKNSFISYVQDGQQTPDYFSGMLTLASIMYQYRGTKPETEASIAETGGNIADDSCEIQDNWHAFTLNSTLKAIIDHTHWLRYQTEEYPKGSGMPQGTALKVEYLQAKWKRQFGKITNFTDLDEITMLSVNSAANQLQVAKDKDLMHETVFNDARLVHEVSTGKPMTPYLRPSKQEPQPQADAQQIATGDELAAKVAALGIGG